MKDNYKILVVDDEPNNLRLLQQVLKKHYLLVFANNGQKALDIAKKHKPDLILLDIMMPEMSGYDVCEKLKLNPDTVNIPVIFVTAMSEIDNEAHGFDVGAVDYIPKPISAPIVLRRIKNHLSLVRVDELDELARASIFMLGEAGHYNDTDTGEHIWRMAAYAATIAQSLGWSKERRKMLELAAPMHDTGKIGIPDEILKAPRKLSADEWTIMKTHSQIGCDILGKSQNPIFQLAAEIALGHHEKWDGTGYPKGLSSTEIPESARIIAIADVFDALTMKRPYKDIWPVEKAVETIKASSGTHFDPNIVKYFCESLPEILKIKDYWDTNKHK